MKYMTFNSSCSYAGVANMLARYGVDTDDRTIAMGMRLPYLFTCENGVYMAGPMLQSADWFNLYLHPIGYRMVETEVAAELLSDHLKRQKTAMLGLRVDENSKHAAVYAGTHENKMIFLNNKWAHDPAPERIILAESELLERTGASAVVATLEQIPPRAVDPSALLRESVSVIRQNLSDIREVCGKEETIGGLQARLNTLFRPLLLDGITMLGLLGEAGLARRFTSIQRDFLGALRQDANTVIRLGDHLSMPELTAAAEDYIQLIVNVV